RTKLAGMKSACTFPTSPKCLRRATSTCLCSFTTQHHSERPSWRNSMTKFITNFRRPKQGQGCAYGWFGFAIAKQIRDRSDHDIGSQRKQQGSHETGSPPFCIPVSSSTCTKSPQHYHRREEFDGAVSTEGEQRGAMCTPSCEEGHHSLHTHPCDCDC